MAHGDDLLFGGKHCARTFNDLATAIAVMSFNPLGCEVFGIKWKSEFKMVNLELTTEDAQELEDLLIFFLASFKDRLSQKEFGFLENVREQIGKKVEEARNNARTP